MYFSDANEAGVLLRLIDVVEAKTITADSAFHIVSEAARHHNDHPGELKRRMAAIEAKHAAISQEQAPIPVPAVADEDRPF